jgi:hypothetical protein
MMEKMKMRKFKWYWPWQDEEQEDWLREMSQKGWHLSSVGLPSFYYFKSGGPEDFVYQLDYRSQSKKDQENYLQLFVDAGWEHVGEMSGWQYFRKPANAEGGLEIFTDRESKIEKYRRRLIFLLIFLLPLFISLRSLVTRSDYPWMLILLLVTLVLFVLYVFMCIKIFLRIKQLQRI